jgi:leader peptidase (prepilin peptidase)/N-methyltransferase
MSIGIELIPVFLFGTLIGSFLNVCILRIPAGESIVTGPSHCMTCLKRLKWTELFPVFSWLFLRGKCSGCKAPVSAQYPLVEAANGVLWMAVYSFMDAPLHVVILGCCVTSALLVIAVIDFRTFEIPPSLNLCIAVCGALRLAFDYRNWYVYLLGFVAVSGFLLLVDILSKGRAIGGGDIKLMAAAGLFLGWKLILISFVVGCIVGSVIHLIRMLLKKAGRSLAFGPYLAAGIFISMLWGDVILSWYL